jgi:hypothetical protein
LFLAINHNRVNLAKELVNCGASISTGRESKWSRKIYTALDHAAFMGKAEILGYFLTMKNNFKPYLRSMLQYACDYLKTVASSYKKETISKSAREFIEFYSVLATHFSVRDIENHLRSELGNHLDKALKFAIFNYWILQEPDAAKMTRKLNLAEDINSAYGFLFSLNEFRWFAYHTSIDAWIASARSFIQPAEETEERCPAERQPTLSQGGYFSHNSNLPEVDSSSDEDLKDFEKISRRNSVGE